MALRASMADIIGYIRRLIGDTAAAPQFTDLAIQDFCDRSQNTWRLVETKAVYTVQSGGVIRYLDFFAETGIFENDIILQDNTWNTVSPTASDNQNGHWTFATQPNWPIYITGKLYDVYAISANLCDAWAATFVQRHDNQSGQFKNSRSQWYTHMVRQANNFRKQAKTTSATMVRGDLVCEPGDW